MIRMLVREIEGLISRSISSARAREHKRSDGVGLSMQPLFFKAMVVGSLLAGAAWQVE